MKIIDVNLLIYAVNREAPLHRPSRVWLESVLSGSETVGFAWNVILAFLRLTTRPAVFDTPLKPAQAFDLVEGWLKQACSVIVHPGERHTLILRELIEPLGTGGNLTSDAHLAALAIEHGAELFSCDGDFRRFPGLRWIDPLAS